MRMRKTGCMRITPGSLEFDVELSLQPERDFGGGRLKIVVVQFCAFLNILCNFVQNILLCAFLCISLMHVQFAPFFAGRK